MTDQSVTGRKPALGIAQIINMSFGFFGIQIGFALQNGNVSRIFQTLGADINTLPLLWLAGPVTGLIMQPIIGYFSDKTWGPLGRRRPYFLAGAILTTLALFIMPNSPALWVAAGTLWILDASLNITMEPFRAFVGDMLPSRQRPLGFSMQTIFIGAGAVMASLAPYIFNSLGVSNTAEAGHIPENVRLSFYVGGIALLAAVLWTIFTTKEYSPQQLEAFGADEDNIFEAEGGIEHASRPASGFFLQWGAIIAVAGAAFCWAVWHFAGDKQFYVMGGGLVFLGLLFLMNSLLVRDDPGARNFLSDVLGDLTTMPSVMKRLAVVQFFSWVSLFIMWIYTTPAVALQGWHTSDTSSAAYQTAGDWVGVMFAVQNGVAAIYAFVIAAVARKVGTRRLHAFNLLMGALGFVGYLVFGSKLGLLVPMVGLGMAWGSILALPYAILADALPPRKMGIYMGIFNFFIVLPQILVGGTMAPILRTLEDSLGQTVGGAPLLAMLFGAGSFALAALAMSFVKAHHAD
ncbi:MAG: MFS transporter [Hyphomonas sp.]|uniref:MFS transporter n=1 Tax=Hyphomonas sp. TaxID=87 RepID=UPI003528D42D